MEDHGGRIVLTDRRSTDGEATQGTRAALMFPLKSASPEPGADTASKTTEVQQHGA
jgi:two-component system nitrogen regulation sensor histidine kinase NtrY